MIMTKKIEYFPVEKKFKSRSDCLSTSAKFKLKSKKVDRKKIRSAFSSVDNFLFDLREKFFICVHQKTSDKNFFIGGFFYFTSVENFFD